MARHAEVDKKTGMVETGFEKAPLVIELVDKANPEKVLAWACGKCGIVCPDERHAKGHCLPNICECGNECIRHYTTCPDCIKRKQDERDRKLREAAEVVSAENYDGPVYHEQQDVYYPDAGEAFEAIADEVGFDDGERKALTLWTCDKVHLTLDANDVIQQALESQEHHEEASDLISNRGLGVLQGILDSWISEHGSWIETWVPSEKKRVEFPQKYWDEYDKEYKDDDKE